MKRVVILQPGYLPWLGFFDLMYRADIFVVLDDVQYTTRDWRSRNRIKMADGVLWLTIPVRAKSVRTKLVKDVEIDTSQKWQKKHLKSIERYYRKAKYFDDTLNAIYAIYEKDYKYLIDADMELVERLRECLGISTDLIFSSEIAPTGKKDEKILAICESLNATHYLTGDAARGYLKESMFENEGIKVEWHNYQHPFYNQLWVKNHGFISHLSVIDLLCNHGPEALDILAGNKVVPAPRDMKISHANDV